MPDDQIPLQFRSIARNAGISDCTFPDDPSDNAIITCPRRRGKPRSHSRLWRAPLRAFQGRRLRASCFWVYAYPAFLRYAAHSAGGYWARISPQAWQMAS